MTPEATSTLHRPFSNKSQRQDLIHELDSFQTSLRNSNASAFKVATATNSISNQGGGFFNSPQIGLDSLEKSLNNKMKNFHQVCILINSPSFKPK